eukprot:CAMPEP_0177796622 /NCGR_PEP_ID=MMETSP0491_2-20121128/26873_1 /TAXON_ID=63592 /ORGANISM="Tetraselmis chuii, Strain PLY429" /LENGTH=1431 /DNA_ID=CAMNT_0019319549 /DNA_START=422 /DNA_END=4717 /DNA_ORIENTATION=-
MGDTLSKPVNGEEPKAKSERSQQLDKLGGWERPPIRRGDSMDAQCQWLQGGVALMGELVKDVLAQDNAGSKLQMHVDNIKALRAKIQKHKLENRGGFGDQKTLWELEDRLEEEQRRVLDLREAQAEQEFARQGRLNQPEYRATGFKSGREVQTKRRMRQVDSDGAGGEDDEGRAESEASVATSTRTKMFLKRGTGGAGLIASYDVKSMTTPRNGRPTSTRSLYSRAQAVIAGNPSSSASRSALKSRQGGGRFASSPAKLRGAEMTSSATGGRIGYFAPGGGFTHPNVFALGGGSQKMLDPDSPAYYGMPTGSPAWRMNIAKAKRAFILRAYVVSAFKMAARLGRKRDGLGAKERLDRMGSLSVFVPLVLDDFTDRFIEQQTQFSGQQSSDARSEAGRSETARSETARSDKSEGAESSPRSVMDKGSGSEGNSDEDAVGSSPLWPTRPATLTIPSGSSPPTSPSSLPRLGSPTDGATTQYSPSSGRPLPPASPLGPQPPATSSGLRPSPAPKSAHAGRRISATGMFATELKDLPRPRTTIGTARSRRGSTTGDSVSVASQMMAEDRRARIKARSDDALLRAGGAKSGHAASSRRMALTPGARVGSASTLANRLMAGGSTRSKLTKANLMGDKFVKPVERPPQEFSPDLPIKSDEELAKAKGLMATYVNRANSRWTDDFKWDVPQMFDIGQFEKLGGLDFQHYKNEIAEMLGRGRLAVQLHAAEQTIEMSDGSRQLLYLADSWAVMDDLIPLKVPNGDRFEGISFGGRQLFELVSAVEALAGRVGSFSIPVIIHVPADAIAAVADELIECKFFGLNRDRVVLVAQGSNKGYFFDDSDGQFKKAPASLEKPNGSGYAMKQLMWNFEASRIREDGGREVMRKSVMSWLKDLGVSWLHSVQIDDVQRLTPAGALDVGALALTLKMYKSNGWAMSLQAAETKDFNVARAAGGVVLSGANEDMLAVAAAAASSPVSRSVAASRMAPGSPSSTGSVVKGRSAIAQQLKIADVQSPKWAVILQQMQRKNGGKVIAPANRFFFNLDKLDELLMRRELFHTNLNMSDCYVYPHLAMSDITTAPDARCVALVPKAPLEVPSLAGVADPADWCEVAARHMRDQDHGMGFRKLIGKYASERVVLRQRSAETATMARPVKGRTIVLFVNDGRASRIAFQFVLSLISGTVTPADSLHIMTSVTNQGGLDAGKELMATSFQDPMLRFMTVRRDVEVRGFDTLVEQMYKYCEERRADLVVMGSDLVQEAGSATEQFSRGTGSLGSITLTAVKHLLRPVLIVKATNKCVLARSNGVTEKVRAVVQVEPTVGATLRYMTQWLDSARCDTVALAKPNGIDKEGNEIMSTRMMLAHFADAVHKSKLGVVKRALEGAFQDCLPALAHRERAHMIVLQTPQTRVMGPELRELIRASPCAVLLNKTKDANPVELSF